MSALGAASVHLVVAITGAALILPFRAMFPDCGPRNGPLTGDPIELRLLVASQKAVLVQEIVNDFHNTGPRVDGRCIEVVEVTSMHSGKAEAGLADGTLRDVDVWLPSARSWVDILKETAKGLFPKDDQVSSINTTPEVIAMPRPMAEYLESRFRTKLDWETIYELAQGTAGWARERIDKPEWGRFHLVRTNPNSSTSGLYSTIFAYKAAKKAALARPDCGWDNGDWNTLTERDVDEKNACIQELVRNVESSVVFYEDSSLETLPYLAKADRSREALQFVSAITVQEVSMVNYNLGSEDGTALSQNQRDKQRQGQRQQFPSEDGKLKAIYPKDGPLYADQPYVILNRGDARKIAAAQRLERYLQGDPEGKFKKAGFRGTHGTFDRSVLSEENGVMPELGVGQPRLPDGKIVKKIKESWAKLRKAARILIVVDVANASPAAEAAKKAIKDAVTHLQNSAPRQEVGFWLVTGQAAGGPGYEKVADIKPVGVHSPPLADRIRVSGGDNLGGPLQSASTSFADGDFINVVVVLTDGYDTEAFNPESLKEVLQKENRQRGVRLFPVGFGAAGKDTRACAQLKAVAAASRTTASCIGAGTPTIEDVLTSLVERF